jgi:hypothetical protein
MRKFFILFSLISLSLTAFAKDGKDAVKKPKIKWKDVALSEKEPVGCEELGKIDHDTNTFMTFSGKGFKEKAYKGIKKKVAKLGGDTFFVKDRMSVGNVATYEAVAYYCGEKNKTEK